MTITTTQPLDIYVKMTKYRQGSQIVTTKYTTMNTTTKPTIASRIAKIIGIEEGYVDQIFDAIRLDKPTNITRARQIIACEYTTNEEKEDARLIWENISSQEIAQVSNLKEAQKACGNVDLKNHNLVISAIEKLVSFAKEPSDLKCFRFHMGYMDEKTRKAHNEIVQNKVIEMVTDFQSCIKIWKDFNFASIHESEELINKTGLLIKLITENPESCAFTKKLNLYGVMPKDHPLRETTFIYGLNNFNTEDELRALYEYLKKELEKQTKPLQGGSFIGSDDPIRKEALFLGKIMERVQDKLDSVCCASITDNLEEITLLGLLDRTRLPKLTRTKVWAEQALCTIWSQRLNSGKKIFFIEALDLFKKSRAVKGDKISITQMFWNIANAEANTKDEVRQMIEATKYSDYYCDTIRSWLIFDPSFEEILAVHKDHSSQKLTLPILIKKAETFEQKIQLIEEGECLQVVICLAEGIQNLKQGMRALRTMKSGNWLNSSRAIVLKSILPFIEDEDDLNTVKQSLEHRAISKIEFRLLVEKALELLGEDVPDSVL